MINLAIPTDLKKFKPVPKSFGKKRRKIVSVNFELL